MVMRVSNPMPTFYANTIRGRRFIWHDGVDSCDCVDVCVRVSQKERQATVGVGTKDH